MKLKEGGIYSVKKRLIIRTEEMTEGIISPGAIITIRKVDTVGRSYFINGVWMYRGIVEDAVDVLEEETPRCDNCGKPSSDARHCIAGGYLTEGEWACCEECYDEMVEKGCCFAELGDGMYRPQKY